VFYRKNVPEGISAILKMQVGTRIERNFNRIMKLKEKLAFYLKQFYTSGELDFEKHQNKS